MDAASLLAFALAFFVFAASPGPDNMTIVARTLSHGPAFGFAYGAGTLAGILIYLALAAFGLSLIAQEMGLFMVILRYAGAAYLIYVAYRLWTVTPVIPETTREVDRRGLSTTFLTAIALNLGNPKMPLFYLALLPGFVGATFGAHDYLALASVIVLVEIVVVGGHVWIAGRARSLMRIPAVVRRVNRLAGTAIGLAGIQILWTTRTN
ncbi:LysE family translocator [Rhizobium wuzhouense]|uniref:LysE family translocator n=1 Tax=Rhizobium wuzhouense TaxID=1986026 RepID=A0ABX5NT69_9HYPH|nr:LysE family translocator [Rhizobium wuzhouense]PYB75193.1 LysE family translocator [Rhizobium wuzhouense]